MVYELKDWREIGMTAPPPHKKSKIWGAYVTKKGSLYIIRLLYREMKVATDWRINDDDS